LDAENEYRYIGSVPLTEESATTGLMICGGKSELPQELSLELLDLLAGQVLAVEQHYLLVDNLQKENRSYTRLIHLLNASFDNISEGVVLLSPELSIQHVNPAAESILGYTSEESERSGLRKCFDRH
jgi:PAS domain-containing protein